MKTIKAKVGTFPADWIDIQGESLPNVGDRILVRSEHDPRIIKWTECIVDKTDRIFDVPVFFLSLV